uniref:Uncharacterized protein n=1 Tax=Cannabis sativa TaxID=3483 RepID=A0A803QHY9_CANSA
MVSRNRKRCPVILVATSNRAPDNLYKDGLQRDLFLPFISTLKERCIVHQISSSVDYRKLTSSQKGFYFVGKDLSDFLKQRFEELIGEHKAGPQEAEVVPLTADGCALFTFEELCERPLGAADYFGLLSISHTLLPAISVLHQVVLRAPVTPDAYHTLGLAHDALGDKKRAFGFYLLAAHLMSKDSSPWKMLVYWSM